MKFFELFLVSTLLPYSVVSVLPKSYKIAKDHQDVYNKNPELKSRFQNGDSVVQEDYNYVVLVDVYITTTTFLFILPTTEEWQRSCTGTIIAPGWVLTSASCYYGSEELDDSEYVVYEITAGYSSSETPSENIQSVRVDSCGAYVHPLYDQLNGDFNVLLLKASFGISGFIRPIPAVGLALSSTEYEILNQSEDTIHLIPGFGYEEGNENEDTLTTINVDINEDFISCITGIPNIPHSSLCGSINPRFGPLISICPADIGAPVVMVTSAQDESGEPTNVRRNVVGVLTRLVTESETECSTGIAVRQEGELFPDYYFIYVPMNKISDWIWNTIQKCSDHHCYKEK